MSYWLEPELQQYFDLPAGSPPLKQPPQRLVGQSSLLSDLRAAAAKAVAEDPVLSFMLRLDSILGVRRGVVTCLATVRRNVHHYELVYLQRFKQIAEPSVRHPKSKEQVLLCLDPKALRCGQRILVKVQTRREPTRPMQLLRECSVLRATCAREPAPFPRAFLFGCLGNSHWTVASSDSSDQRRLVMFKQHFLLCQYIEDSVQRVLDANRSGGRSMPVNAATRMARDMLIRLRHLHSLGWTHGDLRPSCFQLLGGDEMLLGDFVSARPIRRDCLTTEDDDEANGDSSESGGSCRTTYRSVRYATREAASAGSTCPEVFADLESLVYILCSLVSPTPLPWEVSTAADAAATDQQPSAAAATGGSDCKLAVWRFVEEAAVEDVAEKSPSSGQDLWQAWHLEKLFNCSNQEVANHPGYRLALAISRLHRDCTAATAATADTDAAGAASAGCSSQLPNYAPLFDSLR